MNLHPIFPSQIKKIILLLFILIHTSLFAQSAQECIVEKMGREYKWDKKDKKYLENICDQKVYVFWCHDKEGKGYKDGLCGVKERFYAQSGVFEPHFKKFNFYTIPIDGNVRFGACPVTPKFNWEKSVKAFHSDGSYECALPEVQEEIHKNQITVECGEGKTKTLELTIAGPKQNVLKFTDTKTGMFFIINTLHTKPEYYYQTLCHEPVKDRKLINIIRSKINTYIEEEMKRNGTPPAKVKTFGDVRG